MADLIINYILIHAIDDDLGDALETGGLCPGIVLADDGQHEFLTLGERQDYVLDENVAISQSLIFEQHLVAPRTVAIHLHQVPIVILQGC